MGASRTEKTQIGIKMKAKEGSVTLKWVTTDAEQMILDCARVSAPPAPEGRPLADGTASRSGQEVKDGTRLLRYLIKNGHVSPFEMAAMCLEVYTTRDISRQILRHRSLSGQELSQRYAQVNVMDDFVHREARLQDKKNRQNSIVTNDMQLVIGWEEECEKVTTTCAAAYTASIDLGIAREQARALLPEGMTPTRLYISGPIRSWLHYCQVRCGNGTQKEHVDIAVQIRALLYKHLPIVSAAFFEKEEEDDLLNTIVKAYKACDSKDGEQSEHIKNVFWTLYGEEIITRILNEK